MSRRVHRRAWNIPGHAHELTFSCYRRYKLLNAERTRAWLIESIDAARIRHDLAILAYVVMPEHVHLLLFPRRAEYDISTILRDIKQPVARRAMAYLRRNDSIWLERLTRQRGARTESLFWQSGGGYDRNMVSGAVIGGAVRYIHLNPVRRGLVDREIDWRWSSARWYAGLDDGPLTMDSME